MAGKNIDYIARIVFISKFASNEGTEEFEKVCKQLIRTGVTSTSPSMYGWFDKILVGARNGSKRSVQLKHLKILAATASKLLQREMPDNLFNVEYEVFQRIVTGALNPIDYKSDNSLEAGYYICYRPSSYVPGGISVSGLHLTVNNLGFNHSYFFSDSIDGLSISKSEGYWYSNSGGSVIHTTHTSKVDGNRMRTRFLSIEHKSRGTNDFIRYGTFTTTRAEDFIPWCSPICLIRMKQIETSLKLLEMVKRYDSAGAFSSSNLPHQSKVISFFEECYSHQRWCVSASHDFSDRVFLR